MFDMLMTPKQRKGVNFLWLDPSNQTTGDKTIIDRTGMQTGLLNSGEVVVADDGPFAGAKSFFFDSAVGGRDYLRVPSAKLLNMLTGDFCVELFFKYRDLNQGNNLALFGNWLQAGGAGGIILWYKGGNGLTAGFGPFSENGDLIATTKTVAAKTWNHLAYTRAGNIFRLFLNGTVIGSASTSVTRGKIGAEIDLGVYQQGSGAFPDSVSNPFSGWMTGIKCYSGGPKYTVNFTPQL